MAALQNQKAVYLITDRNNGKLYVGSATSNNGMLLQRWENYINSGHGGNKELIELVNKKGIDYIKKNFQYSILENYNAKVDDSVILERESWWVCASKHESGRLIAVEMLSPIFEQKASKSILSLASTFAVSVACAIINSFVFG